MTKTKRIEPEKRRPLGKRLAAQGTALMRQSQFEKAIPLLARAHLLLPEDTATAVNLGGALVMSKRYQQAIPILERARDLAPDDVTVWMNLGAAYLGDLETSTEKQQRLATSAFERAIEIDPIAPSMHYNLGLIYRQRGELDQARQRFLQAIQANPNDQDARRAWLRLNDEEKT